MRIWDINPGYLNRQSLLGEHRELHGIISIIANGKYGYSRHPETIRWIGHDWALAKRHKQLACEMALRKFTDKSPVISCENDGTWPTTYIDEPDRQFQLLKEKYIYKEKGRISLPKNEQQLWSQHKYSVLARDPNIYKDIGRHVSVIKGDFPELALLLVELLRCPPTEGGIRNAIQHMWGYVADIPGSKNFEIHSCSLHRLLMETQKMAIVTNEPYITGSTALSELMSWLPDIVPVNTKLGVTQLKIENLSHSAPSEAESQNPST
ncbi:Pyrimidine dimer DNA glycosylase [Gammaproteobacteria bacterium]